MRTLFSVLSLSFALTGCVQVECGEPLTEAVSSFQLTVGTGDDATDADIFFCITRISDADRDCAQVGNELIDDFDEGSIEDYEIIMAVDAGDLDRVWIENRGDAPDLSLDGDDWELASLRVTARTDGGSVLLFDAPDINSRIDEGEEFEPGCIF